MHKKLQSVESLAGAIKSLVNEIYNISNISKGRALGSNVTDQKIGRIYSV
jgi:hypothetical protein